MADDSGVDDAADDDIGDGFGEGFGDGEDARSLVDAAFGVQREASTSKKDAEAEADVEPDAESGAAAANVPATDPVAAKADATSTLTEPVTAEPKPEADVKPEPEADVKPEPDAKPLPEPDVKPEPEPSAAADTSNAIAHDEAAESTAGKNAAAENTAAKGRLAVIGTAAMAVAAGLALVLTSGAKAGGAKASAQPSPTANPQAWYPDAGNQSAFATGAPSVLTDDQLRAAVPGCDDNCKLVTRGNGFSPDGAVAALFRTGDPVVGASNFKLVIVGGDGKLVWQAPDTMKALSAGYERFSEDTAGNFYLAMPGARSGQILVVLRWQDGKVVDVGDVSTPKIAADGVVGILPQATPGPTATIVAQSATGVSDATTGGLIESDYQVKNGVPVLIGCRRKVGESGEWISYQPDASGCAHPPAGPQGPPDGDGN